MSLTPHIACPDCGTDIAFDTGRLLAGEGFTCGQCGTEIRLDPAGQSQVQDIRQQFEALTDKLAPTGEGNG